MALYDFWLGGCYGTSFSELIAEVGLRAEPHHWMQAALVPTGTAYYWPRLEVA
jgi:hypothetical protein